MFNMKVYARLEDWEPLKRKPGLVCADCNGLPYNAAHLLGVWNKFNEMSLFHTSPLIRPLGEPNQ